MTARVAVALLLALPALAACKGSSTEPAARGKQPDVEVTSDQIIYGMRYKMSSGGIRSADLFGDTAYTKPGDTRVSLKGVRLSFYDKNGNKTGDLNSRQGEYDTRGGVMVARGNVVLILTGEKGPRTVKTEELHYDAAGDKVWSDKPTTLTEDGQTYRGQGFTSNTAFTNLTVQQLKTSGIETKGGMRF